MPEKNIIEATPTPRTAASLQADLKQLGVTAGQTLLVHTSLSALGWVCGGEQAVIEALQKSVSAAGTLVMPAHSGDLSDPKFWENPPVPESWWATIRAAMPPYDPQTTPTCGIGRTAELFRQYPDVYRSSHPAVSFAAWGARAQEVTEKHSLDFGCGFESPLGALYHMGAFVLLLGAGYDSSTCFHLAEECCSYREETTAGAPLVTAGKRVWTEYKERRSRTELFPAIGECLDRSGLVKFGMAGSAIARLFPLPEAVDFAAAWLDTYDRDRQQPPAVAGTGACEQ